MINLSYKMKHNLKTYQLFFGSLANPNRLQIINLLRDGKKNVGEICEATGFEQTMVSHNMKRLETCGMVFMTQEGKYRYYQLNKKTITPLMKMIDEHMHQYCEHVVHHKEK